MGATYRAYLIYGVEFELHEFYDEETVEVEPDGCEHDPDGDPDFCPDCGTDLTMDTQSIYRPKDPFEPYRQTPEEFSDFLRQYGPLSALREAVSDDYVHVEESDYGSDLHGAWFGETVSTLANLETGTQIEEMSQRQLDSAQDKVESMIEGTFLEGKPLKLHHVGTVWV